MDGFETDFQRPNEVDLSFGRVIMQTEEAAIERYRLYDTYYDGAQLPVLPTKIAGEINDLGIIRNLCALVVDTYVAKLDIAAVSSEANQDVLDVFMKQNHWERLTTQTHKSCAKYGDAYLRVWPRKDGGVSVQKLIPEYVRPVYSQDGSERMLWVKVEWLAVDDTQDIGRVKSEKDFKMIRRKDVYYPDHMERFSMEAGLSAAPISRSLGTWQSYDADGLPDTIAYSWNGIPIVHFRNRPDESDFGTSELQAAVPIQTDKDQAEMDLLLHSIYATAGQLWITGFNRAQYETDWRVNHPHEDPPDLSRNPWAIWDFADPLVKLGRLAPEDMTQFSLQCDKYTHDMAVCTRTPVVFLEGQNVPSGVALQEIAGPLIDKVYEGQTVLGEAWESVLNLALRVQSKTEDSHVEWENPFSVDTTDMDLKMYGAGLMSAETFLRHRGLDDVEIKKELELIAAGKQQDMEMAFNQATLMAKTKTPAGPEGKANAASEQPE